MLVQLMLIVFIKTKPCGTQLMKTPNYNYVKKHFVHYEFELCLPIHSTKMMSAANTIELVNLALERGSSLEAGRRYGNQPLQQIPRIPAQ